MKSYPIFPATAVVRLIGSHNTTDDVSENTRDIKKHANTKPCGAFELVVGWYAECRFHVEIFASILSHSNNIPESIALYFEWCKYEGKNDAPSKKEGETFENKIKFGTELDEIGIGGATNGFIFSKFWEVVAKENIEEIIASYAFIFLYHIFVENGKRKEWNGRIFWLLVQTKEITLTEAERLIIFL